MGQMFDKTQDQINHWRRDNPRAFGDQVDHYDPQTTSLEKAKCTGELLSWYGSADLRVKIEPPSCRQYNPGNILAVRQLNWDEIFDQHDDNESWVDHRAPRGGKSRPPYGNDNDIGEGEEDTQGGEQGTRNEKGRKDWTGTGMRKEKGKGQGKAMEEGKGKEKVNGKGKGIVEQTPGGDDISCAIALQLQKEMYEANSETEG